MRKPWLAVIRLWNRTLEYDCHTRERAEELCLEIIKKNGPTRHVYATAVVENKRYAST